jgi:hypothetical protein
VSVVEEGVTCLVTSCCSMDHRTSVDSSSGHLPSRCHSGRRLAQRFGFLGSYVAQSVSCLSLIVVGKGAVVYVGGAYCD